MTKGPRVLRLEDIRDRELGLLVAMLRMPLCAARARRLLRRRGRQDIDWPRLLRLALVLRVAPLLHTVLKQEGPSPVPEAVRSRLAQHCTMNAAHSLQLTAELLGVIRCLDGAGIPAVPFKGPLTAMLAYESVGLRQFGDLDVLIHAKDFPEAIRALTATGYSLDPGVRNLDRHLSRMHEVRLFKQTGGEPILLELHWRLAPSFWRVPLTSEELMVQSRPGRLLNHEVSTLPAGLHFLIGCIGGAKTCFQYLESACYLAAITADGRIDDWPGLDRQAAELGLSRAFHLGIGLSTLLLRARDVRKVVSLVGDPSVPALGRRVLERWGQPWRGTRTYEWTSFQLRVRERMGDRFPYIRNRLMTLGRPGRPIAASFGVLDLLCLPLSLVRGAWLFLRVMVDRDSHDLVRAQEQGSR